MAKKDDKRVMPFDYGKVPPQAQDIEQAILGALINIPTAITKIVNILEPSSFYTEAHQKIYGAILSIKMNEGAIDLLTVTQELRKLGDLDQVGGPIYVTDIACRVITDAHIVHHSLIVAQKYIQREIIRITSEAQSKAYDEGEDPKDVIDYLKEELSKFDYYLESVNYRTDSIEDICEQINEELKDVDLGIRRNYLHSSYKSLDNIIRWCTNEIILIGAQRKAGKSKIMRKLSLDFFKHNANNFACYIKSMEDPVKDVVMDLKAVLIGLTMEQQKQLKGYKLTTDDRNQLAIASQKLSDLKEKFVIDGRKDSIANIGESFDKFCLMNPDKICMLVIDNLALTNDIRSAAKDSKSLYNAQVAAANAIEELKHPNRIIIVIHHIKGSGQMCLENGYRLVTEDLVFHERLSAVITQVMLLNNTGKHKDLVTEESIKPDLLIDGEYVSRRKIIENLLIIEKTEDRGGSNKEDHSLVWMYPANLGTCDFKEWSFDTIAVSHRKAIDDRDRGIDHEKVTREMFNEEMWSIFPEGDNFHTYNDVRTILKSKRRSDTDLPVTFDFLVNKYKQYYNVKVQKQNGKYTRADDQIKKIMEWLKEGMYNQTYTLPEKSNMKRDSYLYNIKI